MKRIFISFILIVASFMCKAQMVGQFSYANDGRVYFFLNNPTGFSFNVIVTANSPFRDVTKRESQFLQPGGGIYLGPSTPWAWEWCEGDTFTITYQNGASQTWRCPYHDYAHESVSFKGGNYILKGEITLYRVGSGRGEAFDLYVKGSTRYVKHKGYFYKIDGIQFVTINNIKYKIP
ncbi:MAG: hypothetical protein IJ151_08275 [Bacteroidales bacterium]|nr:hypothetical protein [Bacteroidales bacterium]